MNRSAIELSERDLGWIEGVIDTDGSLSLIKEKRPSFKAGCTYKPRLNVGNKSLALLRKFKRLVGGGCITKPNERGVMNYDGSANICRFILPQLILVIKERQRLLMVEACDILQKRTGKGYGPRTDADLKRLEEIYNDIRSFNGGAWNK